MGEVVRAHPDGDLGGSACAEGDARGGRVVLARAEHAVRGALVVDHEDGRLVFGRAGTGRRCLADLAELLHIVEVDGVGVLIEELGGFGIGIEVVDLVLEVLEELETVICRHVVVVPVCDGVLDGGQLSALCGEVVPVRRVDDAGCRVGSGGAGRERPARGRVDEVKFFLVVLDVHLRVELEVPVADLLGVRLGGGRLLLFVRRVIGGGGAGGESAQGERRRKRERECRKRAASEFLGIECHRSSFFRREPGGFPYMVCWE